VFWIWGKLASGVSDLDFRRHRMRKLAGDTLSPCIVAFQA
jgi:hypothetical protein